MTNCEVIPKADIGSDHRLVRMTFRINKRLARLKAIKNPFDINTYTEEYGAEQNFEKEAQTKITIETNRAC